MQTLETHDVAGESPSVRGQCPLVGGRDRGPAGHLQRRSASLRHSGLSLPGTVRSILLSRLHSVLHDTCNTSQLNQSQTLAVGEDVDGLPSGVQGSHTGGFRLRGAPPLQGGQQ